MAEIRCVCLYWYDLGLFSGNSNQRSHRRTHRIQRKETSKVQRRVTTLEKFSCVCYLETLVLNKLITRSCVLDVSLQISPGSPETLNVRSAYVHIASTSSVTTRNISELFLRLVWKPGIRSVQSANRTVTELPDNTNGLWNVFVFILIGTGMFIIRCSQTSLGNGYKSFHLFTHCNWFYWTLIHAPEILKLSCQRVHQTWEQINLGTQFQFEAF